MQYKGIIEKGTQTFFLTTHFFYSLLNLFHYALKFIKNYTLSSK